MIKFSPMILFFLSFTTHASYVESCLQFELPTAKMSKGLSQRAQWKQLNFKELPKEKLANGDRVFLVRAVDTKGATIENFHVCRGQFMSQFSCQADGLDGGLQIKKSLQTDEYELSFKFIVLEEEEADRHYVIERRDHQSIHTTGRITNCKGQ